MTDIHWLKQTAEKPLFPDLLWSRPENKRTAGKLLIVGGNTHGFANVAKAYQEATQAGVGTQRIVLPESLRKQMAQSGIATEFASCTQSGSFASSALADILEQSKWADGVLFAGDLGRNSETAILIEKFLSTFSGQVTLTHDAADYIANTPQIVKDRTQTLLVLTIAQLQKILRLSQQPTTVSLDMDLVRLVDVAGNFSKQWGVNLIVKHNSYLLVACGEEISTTATMLDTEDFCRVEAAAHAAVWWLQNPTRTFEALTTSLLEQK